MRTAVNMLLLVALVVLLSLNWVMRSDPVHRNFELLPGMVESVPYDTFARNPNFADGKTLREPVKGTVVRGLMPIRPAAELSSPRVDANRGPAVYASYCETCHGPAGKGDGRVAQRGFPAPPSLLTPRALQLTDGQMFHIVTYGQKNMPPYAAQIDRLDRWAAIAHVRSLQRAMK
jgi:mono/diheme cytochrome c family protein